MKNRHGYYMGSTWRIALTFKTLPETAGQSAAGRKHTRIDPVPVSVAPRVFPMALICFAVRHMFAAGHIEGGLIFSAALAVVWAGRNLL